MTDGGCGQCQTRTAARYGTETTAVKWLLVTSPKVHWSEGSLVRKVAGANSNPNPCPNPNPIPNSKVVFDLRNKKTLNSFASVCTITPFRNSD